MIDRSAEGGQASTTEKIENYPGFPNAIGGVESMEGMKDQAVNFNVEVLQALNIISVGEEGQYRSIRTEAGDE